MADTNPAGSPQTSRHDPDFYIDDGNVVLSAKDTENSTVYFRVHRSTLVKHSPEVFGNMFAVPCPPVMDQYDGVPLVEIPDEATALRELIALLYEPQCISTILESDDFTLKMLGPAKLARKYQVDWICQLVASQLQKGWPTTLVGWGNIADEEAEICLRMDYRSWEPDYEDDSPRLRKLPEPVSSIILARECDAPAILPVAFLHLLRFPFEPDENPYLPPFCPWRVPERALLSQSDWQRLAVGRERIARWFSEQGPHGKWRWTVCGSGMRCEAITYQTWYKFATDISRDGNGLNLYPRIQDMERSDEISTSRHSGTGSRPPSRIIRIVTSIISPTMADNRDPHLYFGDGNIVLSARNNQNLTVYMRLYRGILVENSPDAFGNMFAMPPPPTVQQYDGVPLVEMPDDADDLRGLMTLLFFPRCLPALLKASNFTLRLLGPTQLAGKYQIDWIPEMVASHLETLWPITLEGWDEIAEEEEEEEVRTLCAPWSPTWDDPTLKLRQFPEPASSIFLAREFGAPSILPFAFFRLMAWPLLPPDNEEYAHVLSLRNAPRWNLVSAEDLHRLVIAREMIVNWFSDQRQQSVWTPCGNNTKCETGITRVWLDIATNLGVMNGDFLRSAYQVMEVNSFWSGICPVCKKKEQDKLRKLRFDFAENLSGFFQLD
ncbi:hypothetical protein DFH06DRAFT_972670 [Mycena polygramma]|nr:hypothetical protein DFH06DRAFT_972670 [Mycena polygramma]